MYSKKKQWRCTQIHSTRSMRSQLEGVDTSNSYDSNLSCMAIDDTGNFIATGNTVGEIVVLYNDTDKATDIGVPAYYDSLCQVECPARARHVNRVITSICWGMNVNDSKKLLISDMNDIKLLKVSEAIPKTQQKKQSKKSPTIPAKGLLKIPFSNKNSPTEPVVEIKRSFAAYNIHSISSLGIMANKEEFISGNSSTILLWSFYRKHKPYPLVKLDSSESTTNQEIILSIDCHPVNSSEFIFSTSHGNLNFMDLRLRATNSKPAISFSNPQECVNIKAITDAKFSPGGNFLVARDAMSVKIWDMRKADNNEPIGIAYCQDYVRSSNGNTKESTFLENPFKIDISSSGDIITGSYSAKFHIFDFLNQRNVYVDTKKSTSTHRNLTDSSQVLGRNPANDVVKSSRGHSPFHFFNMRKHSRKGNKSNITEEMNNIPYSTSDDLSDTTSNIYDVAFHPNDNVVAVTCKDGLHIWCK